MDLDTGTSTSQRFGTQLVPIASVSLSALMQRLCTATRGGQRESEQK